jgi:hypothetical protein
MGDAIPQAARKIQTKLVSTAVKDSFALLLENNLDQLQDDLDQLKALDRLKILVDLAGYFLPKRLKATDLQITEQEAYKPIIIDMSKWD